MKKYLILIVVLMIGIFFVDCKKDSGKSKDDNQQAAQNEKADTNKQPDQAKKNMNTNDINLLSVEHVKKQIEKMATVNIDYDQSILDEKQHEIVKKLVKVGQYMDRIYLQQVYDKNPELLHNLQQSDQPADKIRLQYFKMAFGPFDFLNDEKPFYGSEERPAGANFYPKDMTKDEFEKWIEDHPEDEEAFMSPYTVIRRKDDRLIAIPYSEEYRELLDPASKLMKEAAALAENPSLKKYLELRADALLSNDYFDSDVAWVEMKDHDIEVVVGPYEVYTDKLMGLKAAFEAFVTIVDPEQSQKLALVGNYLEDLEKNLPIPDEYKNFGRGSSSPIIVAQEVFAGGDTKAGYQTLGFNLPNDEKVREEKGSKKVLLINITRAKIEQILFPISKLVLPEADQGFVTFDGFFNELLMHEISHGIGPGKIMIDGEETTVSEQLKDLYPTIEEAKADILGVYNTIFMVDQGLFPKKLLKETIYSYVAGIFRSIRFGVNSAHGSGMLIQVNFLKYKEALTYDNETNKYIIDMEKFPAAVKELAEKILTIQATGDYQAAAALVRDYKVETSGIVNTLKIISEADIPVDITPNFEVLKEVETTSF